MRLLVCLLAALVPAGAQQLRIGLSFTGTTAPESHVKARQPDADGAVGPNHIVEFINGEFKVYEKKSGKLLIATSSQEFWAKAEGAGGVEPNRNNTDPHMIYDPAAKRWYATAQRPRGGETLIMVGRSDGADPTGAWRAVTIQVDEKHGADTFADYDLPGLTRDGLYICINQFKTGEDKRPRPDGMAMYAIKKSDLNLPEPKLTLARWDHLSDVRNVGPVMDYDGGAAPGTFFGFSPAKPATPGTEQDLLIRSDIAGDVKSWNLERTTAVAGEKFAQGRKRTPINIAQPGEKPILNNQHAQIAVRVNGEFWGVQTAAHPDDAKRTALRWWRIRASDNAVLGEGILSDAELNPINPSIAVDKAGNIVIGFSAASATRHVGAYAIAGRATKDKVAFGPFQTLKAGAGLCPSGVWGDYSTTIPDSEAPGTFWTFQVYAKEGGDWVTEITQLTVESKTAPGK